MEASDNKKSPPRWRNLVLRRGLEPPRDCSHTPLKRARLPVPPPEHIDISYIILGILRNGVEASEIGCKGISPTATSLRVASSEAVKLPSDNKKSPPEHIDIFYIIFLIYVLQPSSVRVYPASLRVASSERSGRLKYILYSLQ